jgi:hypothetical protein
VGRSDRTVFKFDSNVVDVTMPDSMSQFAIQMDYGQGSNGDSLSITNSVFRMHNRSSTNSGGAISISNRNNSGMSSASLIRGNRFSSDTLSNSNNMFVGMSLG